MQLHVASVITLESGHGVVHTADGEEDEMLAFGVYKGSEDGIVVQLEFGLAVPWCQPWSPDPDEREPSGSVSHV